jgi:RHS repeat-associated protein
VDHLGSTRLVTDENGAAKERYDYLPFGGEVPVDRNGRASVPGYGAGSSLRHKFTGKERDTETGLDYFGARYFSGALGRFTSPDPMIITATRLLDPQGLNLYSYTRNRPTIAVDDGGLGTVVVTVGARQTASVFYAGSGSSRSYAGLARGSSRNRFQENGDTAFGKYKITGYEHGGLKPAYGRAKIRMEPVAGQNEALVASPHRTGIFIHGGGSVRALVPDPYADHQPLISTHGCVRMANADVEDLWGALDDEDEDEQDFVYVGTRQSLQIMSLTNRDLRYALQRQAWLSQLFSNALMQAPAQQKPDPEPDRQPPHPRNLIPRGPDEQ